MSYPYYAFSAEFGSFALEAKYAKDLGKYLFYDEKKDLFLDTDGNEVDITGLDILPRTGVLQAKRLVDAIYEHGGHSTWVKQGDYEKTLDWPDYIKTKRTNIIMSGREILENPEKIIELFGIDRVFFKTKNKNYSQVLSAEKLIKKEGGFYEALKAHQDDEFILSDVVDIKEDDFGMREFRGFVFDGKIGNISRVHDYLVGSISPVLEEKILDVLKELEGTDFPKSFVIDLFEYVGENGETCLDVLECNPLIASGTYLYNSVFGRKGHLNNMPINHSVDPYDTIPTEKMKYGPVELFSKDSKIKGRPSICYELSGGFAADIISFTMFGTASNGMYLHFETSRNIDPTNIGPFNMSTIGITIDSDSEFGGDIPRREEDKELEEVFKQLKKSRRIFNEDDVEKND